MCCCVCFWCELAAWSVRLFGGVGQLEVSVKEREGKGAVKPADANSRVGVEEEGEEKGESERGVVTR